MSQNIFFNVNSLGTGIFRGYFILLVYHIAPLFFNEKVLIL